MGFSNVQQRLSEKLYCGTKCFGKLHGVKEASRNRYYYHYGLSDYILQDPTKTAALLLLLRRRRRRRRGRLWVHPLNLQREEQGDYYHLVQELQLDRERHMRYFRMTTDQMEQLLLHIGPDLTRHTTAYRKPIEAKQRLAVTLRFLATGDSFSSLAFSYRMGESTVALCVEETCKAVVRRLLSSQMPEPKTQDWLEMADRFESRWSFPNCIGAIDGKHVCIQAPPNSGSLYFNYKKTFSVVLLALVDANYRFRVVHVGEYGRTSDGGVYRNSALARGMELQTLGVPEDRTLPNLEELGPVPFVMVGDAAFPLKKYLMRPYPGTYLEKEKRVFNYRLSLARNVVENAFGILSSRWRVLHRRIQLHPRKLNDVILTLCILHNFLLQDHPNDDTRWMHDSRAPQGTFQSVQAMGGNRCTQVSYEVRDKFRQYFCSETGKISSQEDV
ncbi:hypothetical protein ACEWY4_001406 [Coilia grayii]|uniref:DDE Tnp4 domain-containing protein n=1 Tax=Coilia grayii TaxID=363190 RepID=A0ABD1KSU3_9TELE